MNLNFALLGQAKCWESFIGNRANELSKKKNGETLDLFNPMKIC
jgi:hypothetical protein